MRCPVWSRVLQVLRASNAEAVDNPTSVVRWQQASVRVRHTFSLTRRTRRTIRGKRPLEAYTRLLGQTYRATAEVTGARVIVDSSKRPSDAAALHLVDGISPYIVHLVRDPRAVAYSWRRRKAHLDRAAPEEMRRHGTAGSTLSWTMWNAAIESVKRSSNGSNAMVLRYEDFVSEPRAAIGRIVQMLGESDAKLPFVDESSVRLSGNHTISGNPSRFSTGPVAVRPDDEWTRDQPLWDRAIATSLALPLLGRYGYPLRLPGH